MNITAALAAATLIAFGGPRMATGENLVANPDFEHVSRDGVPHGWTLGVPNPRLAPTLSVTRLEGTTRAVFTMREDATSVGRLSQTIALPAEVKALRVRARVVCTGPASPCDHSVVRLMWYAEPNNHQGWPPWLYRHFLTDDLEGPQVSRIDEVIVTPEGANRLTVDLMARWAPGGTVGFEGVAIEPCSPPERRTARLAVVQGHAPWKSSVQDACRWAVGQVETAAGMGADLVCLGEATNFAGTGERAADCAEPIPGGPMFSVLSEAAARHRLYVVAGIYERAGDVLYNSSVLLGRKGELVGLYHKVHLPASEVDDGFTPGDDYPVFETDLGRIGMQICYDNHFMEGSRLMALQGADIVCLPIWGEGRADGTAWPLSVRARAMDNGLYYVAANYTERNSVIVDRNGVELVSSQGREGVYVAEVDLTEGYAALRIDEDGRLMARCFKDVFRKERRPETYGGFTER